MIQSIRPQQNLAVTSRPKAAAQTEAPKSDCGCPHAAAATDGASISFNSPLSNKAEALLQATAADARALEGTLGDHEPGEIILRTRPGTGLSSAANSVVNDFGAKVLDEFDTPKDIHKSDAGEFLHIKLPAGVSVAEAMAAMAKDERVAFAEPSRCREVKGAETVAGCSSIVACARFLPCAVSLGCSMLVFRGSCARGPRARSWRGALSGAGRVGRAEASEAGT